MPRNLLLTPNGVNALIPEGTRIPRVLTVAELQQFGTKNLGELIGCWRAEDMRLEGALQTDRVIATRSVIRNMIDGLEELMEQAPSNVPLFPLFRPTDHFTAGVDVVCFLECADADNRWFWRRCTPHLREGFVIDTLNGADRACVIVSFERNVSPDFRALYRKRPRGKGPWFTHTDPRIMRPEELAYFTRHGRFLQTWLSTTDCHYDHHFFTRQGDIMKLIERLDRRTTRVK